MAREDALTVAELMKILKQCEPKAKVAVVLDMLDEDDKIYGYIDAQLLMTVAPEPVKPLGYGKELGVIFLRGEQVERITMK